MTGNLRSLTTALVLLLSVALLPTTVSADSPATVATERNVSKGTVRLEVVLSERVLHVKRADSVLQTYAVAIGKAKHPTPTGAFRIRRIIWNPEWVPPSAEWAKGKKRKKPGDPENPMGRVKIFFAEPDYYIHGTNAEETVGSAASHGCIRMRNEDVIELARLVMENGGEKRPAGWFRRIINRVTETEEVRLSSPVEVRIRS